MNRQRKMNRQSQWLFEAPFVNLTPSLSNKPMLRRGSRGAAVVELQKLLTQKGFRLPPDGIFGSNTDAAVRNFQRSRGLGVDGIVGPNTWAALLGGSRTPVASPRPTDPPYPSPKPQPSPIVQTVKDIIANGIADESCSTTPVRGLSLQIIAEMNLLIRDALVSINDLNIRPNDAAVNAFMQPAAKEALRRAIQKHGATLKLNSAYRTCAQQHILRSQLEMGKCGRTEVATPGSSNHEDGLAIDTSDFAAWRLALESEGWVWFGEKDKVHFSYKSGDIRDDIGNIGVKAFQQLWNKNNPNDKIEEDGQWGPSTATRMNQSPAEGFGRAPKLPTTQPPSLTKSCNPFQAKFQQAAVKAGVPISWAQNSSLCELVKHESNWNPTVKNPNSSAFGLFQFITKTWTTYLPEVPYGNTDPTWQAVGGFRYIKAVYVTPERAWAFWQATIQKNPSLVPPDLQVKAKEWIAKDWGGY